MITTGEVGFPGFEAAQMCWMPFLQWPLRRQFDSAVLAEAVRHWLPGPSRWFAVSAIKSKGWVQDPDVFEVWHVACVLSIHLLSHGGTRRSWQVAVGHRSGPACRSRFMFKPPGRWARASFHITAQRGKGDWSWRKVKNSSGSTWVQPTAWSR